MFENFEARQVQVDGASIFVRYGGEGLPVVLLHGHPRTSASHGIDSGHHMAEEAPEVLASSLADFFAGRPAN